MTVEAGVVGRAGTVVASSGQTMTRGTVLTWTTVTHRHVYTHSLIIITRKLSLEARPTSVQLWTDHDTWHRVDMDHCHTPTCLHARTDQLLIYIYSFQFTSTFPPSVFSMFAGRFSHAILHCLTL